MRDLITHVPDLTALYLEGVAIATNPEHELNEYFTVDGDKPELTFKVGKTPIHYSDKQSMSVVDGGAISRELINQVDSINVLGYIEGGVATFDSNDTKDTYEAVRGDLTVNYTDEDGKMQSYEKPYLIGVIAR